MKQSLQIIRLKFAVVLFLISISFLASAQWTKKASTFKKRSEVGSVVYNGKLYVFFGFKDYSLNADPSAEVYDPAVNTWKILKSLPTNKGLTHEGIALVDDNVWLIGGWVSSNVGPLSSETWIYNITNNSWSAGPRIIDPATGKTLAWAAGGVALLGRTIHLFGGFITSACDHDQDSYHMTLDVDNWLSDPAQAKPWKNELAPLPIKRNHFGTAVLGGKIYAIGGQLGHDCEGGQDKQYAHAYDPATDTWAQLPMLPTPRSHIEGATFAIDGKIYLAAGQGTNGDDTKQVTLFDPAGNSGAGSWKDDTNLALPTTYEGLSAKVINNTFIISNGGAGGSRYPQNTTYSRTLSRTPVYKLGFPATCVNLNNSSTASVKGQTWLFTIDGTKSYTTSSNAGWLTVTKNATGTANQNGTDIEVTADASGMASGSYSAVITATGTAGGTSYAAAQLCVKLTVQQSSGTSKYTLVTNASGNGTVTKNPDQVNYVNGTNVTITATPAAGQQFTGWSGSASGTTNPLTIVMNANKSITANFQPIASSDLITNLTSTSTKSYAVAQLKTNVTFYTDRTYYVTSVPAFLDLAPFIKTPNDDKNNKSTTLISFTLTQSATLYVAYDPRATALPAWLNGWQKSTSTLGITDDALTYLTLYSKVYPSGKVTLGGNMLSPAAGSKNNYLVIAVAQPAARGVSSNSLLKTDDIAGTLSENRANSLSGFRVYPNPFNGSALKIEMSGLPKHQEVNIVITDLFGKVFQTVKEVSDATGLLKKQVKFNKVLSTGIYTVKVSSLSFNKLMKIVVE